MNRLTNIYIIITSIVLIVGISACKEEISQQQAILELNIQVNMPDAFNDSVKYSNQLIYLKSNRITYSGLTDSLGNASFKSIIPDIYNIYTFQQLSEEVKISGNLPNELIFENKTISMNLYRILKPSLMISKVYGSGTKDNNNKSYRADGYIEIFNNSNEVQYLDSIYLGLVEAHSEIPFPASANPGYIYARQVFRFPGTGKEYPVLPGKSIIIVNSAIDHTQFSPNSVNLINADFEAKNVTFSQNTSIRGIELIYSTFVGIPYLNLVQGGDNGTFLFRTNANVASFPVFNMPGRENGDRYMQIPINLLFDGVEILKNKVTTGPNKNSKRIQSFVDAGYMFITSSGGFTHESIERRVDVSKSTTERVYLIDSNYSLNDFRSLTDPTPKKYDKPLLLVN